MHVFQIGPVPAARGTRVVLVALDTGRMLPPVDAPTVSAALKKLQKAAGKGILVCEPALSEAALELGLAVEPLPEWALPVQAAMALGLAMGPLGEGHQDVETMIELVDAAVAYMAARPWDVWPRDTELELRIEAPEPRLFRAQMHDASLWLRAEASGRATQVSDAIDVLALHIEEPPAFVSEVGLPVLPLPMHLEGTVGSALGHGDLLTLLAAATAVASLAQGKEARAVLELGESRAVATVLNPPPRLQLEPRTAPEGLDDEPVAPLAVVTEAAEEPPPAKARPRPRTARKAANASKAPKRG